MKKILFPLWVVLCLALWTGCSEDEGPEPTLALADPGAEFVLGSDKNALLPVSFTSTGDWQARCDVNWAVPSPQQGTAGACTLNLLAVTENNTGNDRQGVLTITSGNLTLTVNFTQPAKPVLTLDQTVYSVSAQSQTVTIDYQTNLTGEVTLVSATGALPDWLIPAPSTHALQGGTFTVQVDENLYDAARNARLVLQTVDETGKTVQSDAFTLEQDARAVGTSQSMAADGQVRLLQAHTEGRGVPVVIMGDGFLDKDIESGRYEEAMTHAMENLFTEQPYSGLRDYFDVWMVTAVSRNNAFTSGYSTAFSSQVDALNGNPNSTGISGDYYKVMEYAQLVPEIAADVALFEEVTAFVILNTVTYAGTCQMGFSDENGQLVEFTVCYCPTINAFEDEMFRRVLCHEGGGHGFGKLLDEYSYQEQGTIPNDLVDLYRIYQEAGWAMNVDFTANRQEVIWRHFLQDARYQGADAYGETLGVYSGACTYWSGAYRPTNESMMRSNMNGFNAPSREAIYKRVMRLAYGNAWTYDYEEFVAFDQAHLPQPASTQTKAPDNGTRPFAAPRFVGKPLVYARP